MNSTLSFVHKLVEHVSVAHLTEIDRTREIFVYLAEKKGFSIVDEEESEAEKKSREMVPEKKFKGSLSMETFRKALTEKEWKWYEQKRKEDKKFGVKMVQPLNFMEGKRTVYEIVKAVSAEYSDTDREINALTILLDLQKKGLPR